MGKKLLKESRKNLEIGNLGFKFEGEEEVYSAP
jgi:hypothetical protein